MIDIIRGLLGLAVIIGIAWLLSGNRKAINWRLVAGGIILQLVLAVLMLKVPFFKIILGGISAGFVQVLNFSAEGAEFIFGRLTTEARSFGTVFAFRVVPSIIFFSALTSVLYYFGILQKIVYGFAWVMYRSMRLTGAESLAAAANVFVGQTEAPLIVKPYIEKMTRSEILALMTGGMATIAGAVMVAFISFLGGGDTARQTEFGKHLLTASLLSAPAALLLAKILLPETEEVTRDLEVKQEEVGVNAFDAASSGTTQGITLALNVAAILIVFIAFIAMGNAILGWVGGWTGLNTTIARGFDGRFEGLSLEFLFAVLFAPIAWIIGVDWASCLQVGQLLGEKLVLNEFVAYVHLGEMIGSDALTDERAIIIATYALCGFANFSSMGIQIGGIGAIAPSRRGTLSQLAFKSLIAGTFACLMTACIAGMFL
ncbi:MAG: NupC/NupG family nucleoside CNT transporter [Opitutales bacterium]